MISSEEQSGVAETPSQTEPGKRYLGVLRDESPLVQVFGGKVVPLITTGPAFLKVGGRFIRFMLIDYRGLQPEHQIKLLEWIASYSGAGADVARQRIEATGEAAVSCGHFAGVAEAHVKQEVPCQPPSR